jgi:hypothetical protein
MTTSFVAGGEANNLLEWLLVDQKHDCQCIVVAMSEEEGGA